MGKIPQPLRDAIAGNIRTERMRKFPGRGGSKRCAEAFSMFTGKSVSQQQWSPWERGIRTPDESRLEQIAKFFDKTVEYMRRDNRPPVPGAPGGSAAVSAANAAECLSYAALSTPELLMAMGRDRMKAVYRVEISVSSARFVPADDS